MSARDRIIVAAMSQAYANARRLGYSGEHSAEQAYEVALFIKRMVE